MHEKKVEHNVQLQIAKAKQKWIVEYQNEREKKREYIKKHLLA